MSPFPVCSGNFIETNMMDTSLDSQDFDLCVVGATPAGIACAVRAAREGLRVILTSRSSHPGGALSSGLGVWDTAWEGRRAPIYDAIRQGVFDYYRETYGEGSEQYRQALPGPTGHTNGKFEPHVVETLFTKLIAGEKNLALITGYIPVSVEREGRLILSITVQTISGDRSLTILADGFADCTYEGDLLPLSNVPYQIGRESRAAFGEPHAGRIYMRPTAALPAHLDPVRQEAHEALALRRFPGHQEIVLPESTGEGDKNVQAMNYRTVLTCDPANRIPIPKPERYNPEVLRKLEYDFIVEPLPNRKIGWNRPQLLGPHHAYVEGDWLTRQAVMDLHWETGMALLYYLQNDPDIPECTRQHWGQYGLPRDEFPDNNHRPYEIYVREARRLIGRATLTEHDVTLARKALRPPIHGDSIAAIDWYIDSHAVTPGKVRDSLDEGKMMLHADSWPGQVPWRCLLPPDVDNLIVPVCLSATHVAWNTVRLEATWMQIGEVAGIACALAKRHATTPAGLDSEKLIQTLARFHLLLTFFNDVEPGGADPANAAAQYFGSKGFFPEYHARLDEPLTRAVDAVWLEGRLQIVSGTLNPVLFAQKVQGAEGEQPEPMGRTRRDALLAHWKSLAPLKR